MNKNIILDADCPAIAVPSGESMTLLSGTHAYITQALGSSLTLYVAGNLFRVDSTHWPHLGLDASFQESMLAVAAVPAEGLSLEEQVWHQLKTCYDPEIPVNIVDLGLIYACQCVPSEQDKNLLDVAICMTLTAPGCGIGPVLIQEIERKLKTLAGIAEVKVELVFDPPWSRDKMSESAKLALDMF